MKKLYLTDEEADDFINHLFDDLLDRTEEPSDFEPDALAILKRYTGKKPIRKPRKKKL